MGVETMAILSAVGTAVGAVQGFVGQRNQGKAAANMARYQAAVSSNNAVIAQRNAQLAAQEGNAAVEGKQMENRAKIGALKAQQAASGVDINYGSPVDVRSSAAETGQLNAINIRASAVRKAYGYQQAEQDYLSQAGMHEVEAQNARTAGDMNAATTLLGGLSDAGTGWSQYQRNSSTSVM